MGIRGAALDFIIFPIPSTFSGSFLRRSFSFKLTAISLLLLFRQQAPRSLLYTLDFRLLPPTNCHGLRLVRCHPTFYFSLGALLSDFLSLKATIHLLHDVIQTQGDAWFKPSEENVSAGVCIRLEPGQFRVFPYENPFLAPFESAVRGLNPLVAVKVRSAAVHSALATM